MFTFSLKYLKYAHLVLPFAFVLLSSASASAQEACVAPKGDVAGCEPGAFDPPIADMPGTRVGAKGEINHRSTDAEAMAGAMQLEKDLGLFRNMDHLHWVPILPSVTDSNGNKSGGDLDGQGDDRALTIGGQCIFVGHSNLGTGRQDTHPVAILRIQDDAIKNPPVKVGEIPQPAPGYDDTIMWADMYKKADGTQTITMVRDSDQANTVGGLLTTYEVDPASCKVVASSESYNFGGAFHEMAGWTDPNNPKRVLIVASSYDGAGLPDPNRAGKLTPDIRVMAVTDEDTGSILPRPLLLATHTLQDVGGPVRDERPDPTGLFSDGRFPDYTNIKDNWGDPIPLEKSENNYVHSLTMSRDGERLYVAGAEAGFYILNSAAVAHSRNADLAAGKAGCNTDSTNVYVQGVVGGDFDAAKVAQLPNDCVHMVVNDDPGVKALVKAGKMGQYLSLQDRSRFDPYPPIQGATGIHSAIAVPDRPAPGKDNTKSRPHYLVASEERGGCPTSQLFILDIESEMNPQVIGTFGVPINEVQACIAMPTKEPNGEQKKKLALMAHNPTVFQNLVFITWYGQGLRVLDISNPRNPREVGHANTIPNGQARSYAVLKDGLFYWVDNGTGLHVARYTGPRSNELPAKGIVEGNGVPHL